MLRPDLDPGLETIEARLVRLSDIPWEDLAFETVRWTLERYVEDRSAGNFGIHTGSIGRRPRESRS